MNGLSFLHTKPATAGATAGVTELTSGLHSPNHRVGTDSQSLTPETEP